MEQDLKAKAQRQEGRWATARTQNLLEKASGEASKKDAAGVSEEAIEGEKFKISRR